MVVSIFSKYQISETSEIDLHSEKVHDRNTDEESIFKDVKYPSAWRGLNGNTVKPLVNLVLPLGVWVIYFNSYTKAMGKQDANSVLTFVARGKLTTTASIYKTKTSLKFYKRSCLETRKYITPKLFLSKSKYFAKLTYAMNWRCKVPLFLKKKNHSDIHVWLALLCTL